MCSRENSSFSALYLIGPVSLRGGFHSDRQARQLELVRTAVAGGVGAPPPALRARAGPGRMTACLPGLGLPFPAGLSLDPNDPGGVTFS